MKKVTKKIMAISLKTNAIKLDDNNWYPVNEKVSKILDRLEKGEVYEFTIDEKNNIIFVNPSNSQEDEKEVTEKVSEDRRLIAKAGALKNATTLINTIALVAPQYLIEKWEKKDPFDYLLERAETLLKWLEEA